MKRIVCMLLSALLLLPVIASFGAAAAAESTYEELWAEKEAYIQEKYDDYFEGEFIGEFYYYWPLISPPLTVLLYTDIGQTLTITRSEEEEPVMIDESWFRFENGYLVSPELTEATEACRAEPYGVRESVSGLRECIQYFGITKIDLLTAFQRMKEQPDSIRPLLTMLTDDEYEEAKWEDGTFGKTDWPEFVIEALFMEDDAMAHRLLTKPFSVYVPEIGRVVETFEMNYEGYYDSIAPDNYITFDRLKSYDLTSDAMGEFIEYQQRRIQNSDSPYAKEIEKLATAREAQLQAKSTGDSTVTSVLVLALAVPALGAVVLAKKKRKI